MTTTSTAAVASQATIDAAWDKVADARIVRKVAESKVDRAALHGSSLDRITAEANYSNAARVYARAVYVYGDALKTRRTN